MRVRNFREGKEKWIRGTVVTRLGPVSYRINDGVRERTVHIDHLFLSHEKMVDCNISSDDTHLSGCLSRYTTTWTPLSRSLADSTKKTEPLKSNETVSFFGSNVLIILVGSE